MATYYGSYGGYLSGWRLKLDVTYSQSISGNYSNVTAKLYIQAKTSAYNVTATEVGNIKIDGTTYSYSHSTTTRSGVDWQKVHESTKKVYHDSNGNKTISLSGYFDSGWSSFPNIYVSGSLTLPRIPLAPTISEYYYSDIDSTSVIIQADCSSYGHGTSGTWDVRWDDSSWLGEQADIGGSGNNTWTKYGLTPNTKYEAYSKIWNNYDDASWSSTKSLITKPSGALSTLNVKATTVELRFLQTAGNQTIPDTYIHYKEIGQPEESVINKGRVTSFIHTLTGLKPNTEYEIWVDMTGDGGDASTTHKTITTLPAVLMIKPDGSVVNAVPYKITTSEIKMLDVKRL